MGKRLGFGLALVGLVWMLAGCESAALRSANIYIQQQNWEKAEEQLKLAVQQNPNDAQAHFKLGAVIYARDGRFVEMNQELETALKISPTLKSEIDKVREQYWIKNFNAGVQPFNQGNYAQAVEKFKIATLINPNKMEGFKQLAACFLQMDSLDKAIANYEVAIRLNPEDIPSRINLAQIYYNREEYEKTIEVSQKILGIDSGNINAISKIAYSYDMLGEKEEAEKAYLDAIAAQPDNKNLYYNLGVLYANRDDSENAVEQFKKVLELDPDDVDANYNLGLIFYEQVNYKEMIPYFEKVVDKDPGNTDAWNLLGAAYINIGETEKGKIAFAKAKELQPEP